MPPPSAHRALPVAAACVVIAAVSLVAFDQPAYDPMAWLIWGRQIAEGTLHTVAGPSWKPLPVLVTAPAAALMSDAAPLVWLVVARAGGLVALVLAFRLASRLGGRAAGAGAVAALLPAETFLAGIIRGNSEGLLVAVVLGAIDRQLAGRGRQAFALGVAAALLRPEAWPLVGMQALWFLREAGRRRGGVPWPALAAVGLAGAAVLAAWFVPERIGSGSFLRAAERALEPVADSPAQADRPFLAVFTNSAQALAYPVYVLAVVAVVDAWRRRRRAVLGVAAVSAAWMLIVALLAEAGFTGNLRYVTLPASLVCVLAGVGLGALLASRPGRPALAAGTVLAAPGIVLAALSVGAELGRVAADERLYDALPAAVQRAGGAAAVNACGAVLTGPFQTQHVAWELHRRQVQVGLRGDPPGTVIARPGRPIAEDPRFPLVGREGGWIVRRRCHTAG